MSSLTIEKYSELYGLLIDWRITAGSNPYKGILSFVSGLRFSVRVLYIVKDVLIGSKLKATWGHIVEEGDVYANYSNECDIIIYKEMADCVKRHWNGHNNSEYKTMDFKFINHKAVVGVISCKTHTNTSNIEKEYPQKLKTFTKNVWLFAEYCDYNSYSNVKSRAKKLGYKDFWCLYEWDPNESPKQIRDSWLDFDKMIIKLAKQNSI